MQAAVSALHQQPVVNAVIDGDDIIYRDYVDISIAVGTSKVSERAAWQPICYWSMAWIDSVVRTDSLLRLLGFNNCLVVCQGLVVPVIRGADHMSFAEIEKTISALGKKANDGSISIDDMAGGTFTISNGGVYGSLISTPIINPPQV